VNLTRATEMVVVDQTHDSPYVYRYVAEHVPPSEVVGIAYAPNYHLGRELFFRTGGRQFVSKSFQQILADPQFRTFILAYPSGSAFEDIRDRYPNAEVIVEVDGTRMKNHYIIVTNQGQAAGR
jgi:hypothetical protein